MATATATKSRSRVKVSKKVGTVRSNRAKPVTKAEVEKIVSEAIYMANPAVQIYNGTAAIVSGVYSGAATTLKSICDTLADAAQRVWVFLGHVYDTVVSYTKAVLTWVADQIAYAFGAAKKALQSVYDYVSSMSVDWVAVNGHVVNLMCAAAAFGVAVTAGTAVGVTTGAIAATVVGTGTAAKVTALLMAAITANAVGPVAYTLFQSGVSREQIALGLAEAEAQQAQQVQQAQAPVPVTVNAVAVRAIKPATT